MKRFYHLSKDDAQSYPELPDDFRMVAGNMKRDSLDMSRPADQAVSFQCFGPGYDCESDRPFPSGISASSIVSPHTIHSRRFRV